MSSNMLFIIIMGCLQRLGGKVKWECVLTLQSNFVSLQREDRLPEQILRALVSGLQTSDIHLFPLDRDIVLLEDLLDRVRNLRTDTVTL